MGRGIHTENLVMGMDPISITAIGLAIAGAATGGAGAVIQRQNAKEQSRNLRDAQANQQQQLVNQHQLEKRKNESQAGQLQARLRVLAGESGLALGGSLADLSAQTDYDRALNDVILKMNLGNSMNALNSQAAGQQVQIKSQVQNPLLAGLLGGMGGLGAGLSLGQSIDTLMNRPLPQDLRDGTTPKGG